MNQKIKKQIDGIRSNINEEYFAKTINELTTSEEFEYFFSILTNMYGYNASSPANVTSFYKFFATATPISFPIILKYVIKKKLHNGWATLVLRNKSNWTDEVFELWLQCYEYISEDFINTLKNEKHLNHFTEHQLRRLITHFEKNAKESLIADFAYIEFFEKNIDKFKFMEPELYTIFYNIMGDDKYLPVDVQNIFIF